MISLFGAQYSLLTPWALLSLIPLVGLLVLAYLKRGKTIELIVSSAMFLPILERRYAKPKTFVPPLRLLIELLIVSLFCLALARLTRTDVGSVTIVLIDNSLSMSALDNLGRSTLDRALKDADGLMATLSAVTKVEVYQTSPSLLKVATGAPSIVRSELVKIRPLPARDNLEGAISSILKDERLAKLAVFSDRAPRHPKQSLQDYRLEYNHLSLEQPSAPANLAIVGISQSGKNIELMLANYSTQALSANVLIESVSIKDSHAFANKLAEIQVKVPAASRENFSFDTSTAITSAFRISVSSVGDSITLDNQAWLYSSTRSLPLTFVGPLDPAQLGLRAIPKIELNYLTPDNYESASLQQKGPIIFHRMMPAQIPDRDSAIVMPPETDAPLRISAAKEAATLTSWQASHPLLSYLKFSELQLGTVRPISIPAWGKSLLTTSTGSALVFGHPNGARLAVYGFELFPFEGRNNTASSVLTLNLLSWLNIKSSAAGYELAPLALAKTEQAVDLFNPDRKFDGEVTPLLSPGLFSISKLSSTELVAANFFDEKESDLRSPQTISLPEANFSDLRAVSGESLIPSIAGLLLFLILVDYLVANLLAKRQMRRA